MTTGKGGQRPAVSSVLNDNISETEEQSNTGNTKNTRFSVKKTFEEGIKDTLDGRLDWKESVYVGKTPQVLLDLGFKQSPMLMSQKHIRDAVAEENKKGHKHGLSVQLLVNAKNKIQEPLLVIDSWTRTDSVVVVTNESDEKGRPIIISIKPNGSGQYEMQKVQSNFITSMYGRNNIKDYLKKAIEKNSVIYIDKQKNNKLSHELQVQFLHYVQPIALDKGIIKQSENIVKSNVKKETNTQQEHFSLKKPVEEIKNLRSKVSSHDLDDVIHTESCDTEIINNKARMIT